MNCDICFRELQMEDVESVSSAGNTICTKCSISLYDDLTKSKCVICNMKGEILFTYDIDRYPLCKVCANILYKYKNNPEFVVYAIEQNISIGKYHK